MPVALKTLLQATRYYQAQVDAYTAGTEWVEQACIELLEVLEQTFNIDTEDTTLTLTLLDNILYSLDATRPEKAKAFVQLRQTFIDSQDIFIPSPNHQWASLSRQLNKKLSPLLDDSLYLFELNIAELFHNVEQDRHQNEQSFATTEPTHVALLQLNQYITLLSSSTLSANTQEHIGHWRQFFDVYVQLAQQMDVLKTTLHRDFLSLSPLIDEAHHACLAAQQKLMATGFKHTRPIDLGITFIFSPHLTSILSAESQLSHHPPLRIPIDYTEQRAINRNIDRIAKICAEALTIRIKAAFQREARQRGARTKAAIRAMEQTFASHYSLIICPAQETTDHRYFAAKVAEYLSQANLLNVTYQTMPAGYDSVTSASPALADSIATGLASSAYATIYHHNSSVHLSDVLQRISLR